MPSTCLIIWEPVASHVVRIDPVSPGVLSIIILSLIARPIIATVAAVKRLYGSLLLRHVIVILRG